MNQTPEIPKYIKDAIRAKFLEASYNTTEVNFGDERIITNCTEWISLGRPFDLYLRQILPVADASTNLYVFYDKGYGYIIVADGHGNVYIDTGVLYISVHGILIFSDDRLANIAIGSNIKPFRAYSIAPVMAEWTYSEEVDDVD